MKVMENNPLAAAAISHYQYQSVVVK